MKQESKDYTFIITRDNLMKVLDKAVTSYREDLPEGLKEIYSYSSKELNFLSGLKNFKSLTVTFLLYNFSF